MDITLYRYADKKLVLCVKNPLPFYVAVQVNSAVEVLPGVTADKRWQRRRTRVMTWFDNPRTSALVRAGQRLLSGFCQLSRHM